MRDRIRHTIVSSNPRSAAVQAGENARDANESIDERLAAYLVTVERYAATGSADAQVRLTTRSRIRPRAVLLVRAQKTYDRGARVPAAMAVSFSQVDDVLAFEPGGLTASEFYDLTFMLVE